MKVTDKIQGPTRGTAKQALSNIDRPENIDRAYAAEVYRVSPLVGIDASVVCSQWHLETNGGTSYRFRVNGNPAGLGIASDNDPDPATFTGVEAARVHVWALLVAVDGTLEDFATLGKLAPIPKSAHPFCERWNAKYHDPNCPLVATIDDLNIRYKDATGEPQATWGWDAEYEVKLVGRSRVLYGDSLPDQEGTPVTEFRTAIPGLPGGPLVTDYPVKIKLIPEWRTNNRPGIKAKSPRRSVQHGNGNPNSTAAGEANYLFNGAEGRQASYHASGDDIELWIMVPLDEVTWQAADGAGPGNMNGYSCEMVEDSDIWTNPTRRARCIHVNADFMGRVGARLGVKIPEQHFDFNFNNPPAVRHNCPDKLRHVTMPDGRKAWDHYADQWQAARANELQRMGGTVATTTTPAPKPTTTTTTTPAPAKPLRLPKGTSTGEARARFNPRDLRNPANNQIARFNLNGTVSQAWLRHVLASNPEGKTDTDFRWPSLVSITKLGNGTISWQFSDGYVWEQD